jgi:hypothetical protein
LVSTFASFVVTVRPIRRRSTWRSRRGKSLAPILLHASSTLLCTYRVPRNRVDAEDSLQTAWVKTKLAWDRIREREAVGVCESW